MTDVEVKVEKLDDRVSSLEKQVAIVAAKVDMVIAESQQQREDMRRLWERQDAERAQREADMKAAREKQEADMKAAREKQEADMKAAREKQEADMKAAREKQEADMKTLDAKIDANAKEFTKQLHSNFVQTMIGVGAIMAAIGGLIIAAVR